MTILLTYIIDFFIDLKWLLYRGRYDFYENFESSSFWYPVFQCPIPIDKYMRVHNIMHIICLITLNMYISIKYFSFRNKFKQLIYKRNYNLDEFFQSASLNALYTRIHFLQYDCHHVSRLMMDRLLPGNRADEQRHDSLWQGSSKILHKG